MKKNEYHEVRIDERVRCVGRAALNTCGKPAVVCEHMHWSTGNGKEGVSFFYYCTDCDPRKQALVVEDHSGSTGSVLAPATTATSLDWTAAECAVIEALRDEQAVFTTTSDCVPPGCRDAYRALVAKAKARIHAALRALAAGIPETQPAVAPTRTRKSRSGSRRTT